jgi:AAA domain
VNTLELPRDAAGKTAEDYLREFAANDAPARFRVMSAAEFLEVPTTAEENKARIARYKAQDATHYARVASGENDLEIEAVAQRAAPPRLSRHISDILANPSTVRWLKRDEIEKGVIAILAGPRGVGKSSQAENWYMHTCVELGLPVLVLTAEGTGTDRHVQGWLNKFAPFTDPADLPLRIVERRLNFGASDSGTASKDLNAVYDELKAMKAEYGENPAMCVIDTFSKYSGSLQHNDNSAVSAWLGGIDAAIRRPFDCTVLLCAHTGLADSTRVRGASSIEADTDAAYMMTKEGDVVSMSRQRFKDSPELPPLIYKLETVDLNRTDADGLPVTTRVLVKTDAPVYQRKAAPLKSANQRHAYAAVKQLSPSGDAVLLDVAVDKALEEKGITGASREQRRNMRESFFGVRSTGRIWIEGDNCGSGGLPPSKEDFE